ncbi:hypothetical protein YASMINEVIRUS_312 [Yasminevirus sp. GU-2018]|uniref:VWFA domain-containing protein n=1 Tax=Yasminevirus sp. GU-2018 TaxID=2420051 RepID=A0A5K0U7B7_9VIRU|nr:hypothetical protein YASMINEVIRUS_312 [Yasminevirus sp. GU-2018]
MSNNPQHFSVYDTPPPAYGQSTSGTSNPPSEPGAPGVYGAYTGYAPSYNPILGQNYTPVIMAPTAPSVDYPYNSNYAPGERPGLYPLLPADPSTTALKAFFRKYEISPTFQEDVDVIRKYDIIIIGDDSTSMRDPSRYLSYRTNTVVNMTRWDELKETVAVVTELACILDDDGIDVRFLNEGKPHKNISSQEQVMALFNRAPTGRTPLTRVLREVMAMPTRKPKLILIVTDGEPNDDDGYDDSDKFLELVVNRDAQNNRIGILVCTSAEKQMKWLQRVDKEAKHVDVVDDYYSEREQILEIQGSGFSYSHGDHVLKMLLGPILQKYDDLDEKPLKRSTQSGSVRRSSNTKQKSSDCIII